MASRQQFIFNNKTVGITNILFKNVNPLENIEKIVFFKETELSGTWLNKEFRYSFDNIVWSSWRTLTQQALQNISFENHPLFYVEFLYTRSNYNTADIKDFYLFYDSASVTPVDPSISGIDATTLAGEEASFYLDRTNFTGAYNDLQVQSIGDSSSASVYYSRLDTSDGTTFNFRGLKGTNGINVYTSDRNIIIDGSLLSLNVDQRLNIIDGSLGNLYDIIEQQDASIIRIDLDVSYLYTQIGTRDLSINELYKLSEIQDSSITRIDSDISSLQNIDTNLESSIGRIDSRITDIDSSINRIDTRIIDIDSSIIRIDSSVNYLTDYVLVIDQSLNDINLYQTIQDLSINNSLLRLDLVEVSVNYLDSWNQSQDSSIDDLRSQIINLDTSIYREDIDASLDVLRYDISVLNYDLLNIQSYLTVIDSSIIKIDSSLSSIFSRLEIIDTSIVYLSGKVSSLDSSITRIDSDISTINYDISILQSNILTLDSSIKSLFNYQLIQDNSINYLVLKTDSLDSSIIRIDSRIIDIDSSIIRIDYDISTLYNKDVILDGSIIRIDSDISTLYNKDVILDGSIIRIDTNIINLQNKDIQIDSSIIRIDNILNSIEASIALITDDQVINIGEGSIGIYSDRDSSNNILLKTIDQIGPVIISEDSSTILIDSSIVKLYDTSLANTVYAPYTVGGFENETSVGSINRDTYTNIINELLFPTTEPSISLPTSVFTMSGARLYEIDYNPTINFSIEFIDGSIMVGDVYQGISSGPTCTYHIIRPGHHDVSISTDRLYSNTIYADLDQSVNVYKSWVEYSQGPITYDNKGNSYSFLPEGSTNVETIIIETTYPFFSNFEYINVVDKEPSLYSMITGNNIVLEFAPEVGDKGKFDIAEKWVQDNSIIGIETYMGGDDWAYEGGSESTSLMYWTPSSTMQNVGGILRNYIRYTYNGVNRGRTKIRLKF